MSLDRLGPTPGRPGAGNAFGAALRIADVDGDGRAELAVGIPGERVGTNRNAGAVMVFDGLDDRGRRITQRGPVPGAPGTGARFGSRHSGAEAAAGSRSGDGAVAPQGE